MTNIIDNDNNHHRHLGPAPRDGALPVTERITMMMMIIKGMIGVTVTSMIREVAKNRIFFGKADRKVGGHHELLIYCSR